MYKLSFFKTTEVLIKLHNFKFCQIYKLLLKFNPIFKFQKTRFQPESEVSEYTYERTLKMEERVKFLREMKAKERRGTDVPATMDEVVLERRYSKIDRKQSTQSQSSPVHAASTPPMPHATEKMAAPINKVRFSENSVEVCFFGERNCKEEC